MGFQEPAYSVVFQKMTMISSESAYAVLLGFYRAMDDGSPATVAASFTSDAVWTRRGVALEGREAIRRAIAERPDTTRTAHLVTNFLADGAKAGPSTFSYYLTGYLMSIGDDNPHKPQLPFQLAFMQVEMGVEEEKLLIHRMSPLNQKFMR